jgi:phosphoglycolate phosphatase
MTPIDVLLDLDGTIHDPAPGIIGSIQFALRGLGLPVPDASALRWAIGPPLRQSFPELGVKANDIEHALTLYRENYRDGAMYEAIVYPGIATALEALQARGHRLYIATSKPHVFAQPILEKFGLAAHFRAIHGAELDGTRDDKADLIAFILATEGIDKSRVVMIGDRKFDCLGAVKNGIPCFGVLWGYGSATELREAGATQLLATPADLVPAISSFKWA